MQATVEPTEILIDRLLQQPIRRAELLVRNDRRFQTTRVADALRGVVHRVVFTDPKSARQIAHLAQVAAGVLDSEMWGRWLVGRSRLLTLAELGNAHRCCGDLESADRLLSESLRFLPPYRSGFAGARVLGMLASLRIDQRRPAEAEAVCAEAIDYAREAEDDLVLGRTLCSLGYLRIDSRPTAAEAEFPLKEALAIVDPEEDPWLAYCIRQNLTQHYLNVGRPEAARRLFEKNQRLFRRQNERLPFATRLEGGVAAGIGDHDRAEDLLRRAWREFQRRSLPHDWGLALVALDIAALYARSGRWSDLKRFGREMAPALFWPGVHREAIGAIGSLLRAIEFDSVRPETIDNVASFVRRSRFCPGLAFELS